MVNKPRSILSLRILILINYTEKNMKWNLYQQRMIIRILINNLLAKILLKTYYNYKTIISIQI